MMTHEVTTNAMHRYYLHTYCACLFSSVCWFFRLFPLSHCVCSFLRHVHCLFS